MPYYCTVPRCTSMAGKAKNVSFHQFPRDVELAKLWNKILKRGKPYTKYSKVCSLHFRPEDYTVTSVGKKGQWRTLRKDAIPSRNLPSDSPLPHRSRDMDASPSSQTLLHPQIQQHLAQAIYMQTMLVMQAAAAEPTTASTGSESQPKQDALRPPANLYSAVDIEQYLSQHKMTLPSELSLTPVRQSETSYKCSECLRCFKDPDVFILHQRSHETEKKENVDTNEMDTTRQETLKQNPILANLLKTGNAVPNSGLLNDVNNIASIENQIMTAMAANMEAYIKNLSSMLGRDKLRQEYDDDETNDENDNVDTKLVIDERCGGTSGSDGDGDGDSEVNSGNGKCEADINCDNDSVTVSKETETLVIEENV